jgi:hypothetical protein
MRLDELVDSSLGQFTVPPMNEEERVRADSAPELVSRQRGIAALCARLHGMAGSASNKLSETSVVSVTVVLIAVGCVATPMSKFASENRVQELVRQLDSPDIAERGRAIDALGEFPQHARLFEHRLCGLLRDANSDEEESIWNALASAGGKGTVERMSELLRNGQLKHAGIAEDVIRDIWERVGSEVWTSLPLSFRVARGVFLLAEEGPPARKVRVRWILDERSSETVVGAGRHTRTSTTNEAGEFEIETPRWPGTVTFWIEIEDDWIVLFCGQFPRVGPFRQYSSDLDWPRIVPARNHHIRVVVTDEHGSRLRSARAQRSLGGRGGPFPALGTFRPDQKGEIHIGPIAYAEHYLNIDAPGFAPVRIRPYLFSEGDEGGKPNEVSLRRGRRLLVEIPGSSPKLATTAVRIRYGSRIMGESVAIRWAVAATIGGAEFVCPIGANVTVDVYIAGEIAGTADVMIEDGIEAQSVRIATARGASRSATN